MRPKQAAAQWTVMIGIGLLAVLLGILTGVSAGITARIGLVIFLLLVVMLAWAMPDLNTSAKPIAWAFIIFALMNLVWPRLVVFWVRMTVPTVRAGLSDRLQSFQARVVGAAACIGIMASSGRRLLRELRLHGHLAPARKAT